MCGEIWISIAFDIKQLTNLPGAVLTPRNSERPSLKMIHQDPTIVVAIEYIFSTAIEFVLVQSNVSYTIKIPNQIFS